MLFVRQPLSRTELTARVELTVRVGLEPTRPGGLTVF
jgi:hypothetical protein